MKKKISIIVVCLLVAVFVVVTTKKNDTGINSIKSGVLVWVKCGNEACNAEYQIQKRDYYAKVQEKRKLNPMSTMDMPVDCQKCGTEALRLAEKCGECGYVFFKTSGKGEYGDKCPKCGYSAAEVKSSGGVTN